MAVTTATAVAEYLVRFCHEVGDPITNLKLQKLLYYAQAWHLGLSGEPLFREPLEAWARGPVCPPVYRRWKAWEYRPIEEQVPAPDLPESTAAFLREILTKYGGRTAWELEQQSHRERPWLAARGDVPEDAWSDSPISEDEMKAYFAPRSFGDERHQQYVRDAIREGLESIAFEGEIPDEELDLDDILQR